MCLQSLESAIVEGRETSLFVPLCFSKRFKKSDNLEINSIFWIIELGPPEKRSGRGLETKWLVDLLSRANLNCQGMVLAASRFSTFCIQ